ncbi:MAG: neutral zinc metallopeptidase, partial [Blastocatellia bacterium]|nr:neutral zinc metallopeptidase [Blastocatellia bacterium]
MRWGSQRQSTNVEDRRGMGRGIAVGGGGLGVLVLAVIILLCGGDPRQLLDGLQGQTQGDQTQTASNRGTTGGTNDVERQFVSAVLGSTEDAWGEILPAQAGMRYQRPNLVLFTREVSSACGYASSATGPFYCPGDNKLYLDYGFFDELERQFKAPGEFAQAYVIAHEVGHHVQNLLGTM